MPGGGCPCVGDNLHPGQIHLMSLGTTAPHSPGSGPSHTMSTATGNRRILVIGSQCEALGKHARLSFLPQAAEELYAVMTDPDLGHCVSALPEGGLMIDPTVAGVKDALKEAFRLASEAEATLLLALIGHGCNVGNDYYFLPRDASSDPEPDTGIHAIERIKHAYRAHRKIDGLVLLVDTCHSGLTAEEVARKLVGEYERGEEGGRKLRFEIFTASAPNRIAWDGCFTKTVTHCLRRGLDDVPTEELRCQDVERIVRQQCSPRQLPQILTFTPGAPLASDAGLWLARNAARARCDAGPAWAGTWAAKEIARLTADFQPTPTLERLVAASGEHRSVALVGVAGAGKSTLAAALVRPEITDGAVPDRFAHAVAFLTGGLLTDGIARLLADQLARAVPGFVAARDDFQRTRTEDERRRLDALQLDVVGPLRHHQRPDGPVVRIVADGLDQLATASESAAREALADLAAGPGLGHVRLIMTARPDTDLPDGPHVLRVDKADDALVSAYLAQRGVPPALHAAIVERGGGNWLVTRLLADLALTSPGLGPGAFPADLKAKMAAIYAENLRRAGASSTDRWRRELRPVLGVLAAAGVGPVLPMKLLCAASARLGGHDRPYLVRDVLVDLRGLVVRDRPGTDDEHVGLFHPTLAEFLLDPASGPFGIDPVEPHRALAESLAELAPAGSLAKLTPAEVHAPRDPLHRYAAVREPDHLWAIGEYHRLLYSLSCRCSVIPAENLRRYRTWYNRLREALGPDHPYTLTTRGNIASLTGEVGEAREALRRFGELLPDLQRVRGPDHLNTLTTRNSIASCTGEVCEAREALRLTRELLPDQQRVLGPDHPITLTTRANIALWTGEVGEAREALRLFGELLPDQQRILGPDHPNTLTTRNNIASWTARAGNAREALRLFRELLPDQQRVLGPDHPITLTTRNNIAHWTGEVGEARKALRLFGELLPDLQRVLGPDHPNTLRMRGNIANWTARAGRLRKGEALLRDLIPDMKRVMGPDHPETKAAVQTLSQWKD